jgi:hypothetical protein
MLLKERNNDMSEISRLEHSECNEYRISASTDPVQKSAERTDRQDRMQTLSPSILRRYTGLKS